MHCGTREHTQQSSFEPNTVEDKLRNQASFLYPPFERSKGILQPSTLLNISSSFDLPMTTANLANTGDDVNAAPQQPTSLHDLYHGSRWVAVT